MSQLYPDLINNFPNDIDPNRKFQDVTSANKALVLQYYTYKEAGNDAAATDLLNTNPALKDTIVTAEMIQYIYDMNVSQQRFYLNDVQTYLVNLVKPKGYFSETTKYTKYDTVQYTVNGAIQSYMGAKVDIPIGTLPTNTTYFNPITLRGEKGASGTGLSVRGVWNSLDQYYVNDCVSWNNAMWYAVMENTNSAPNDLSENWKKFADLPRFAIASDTQPAAQNIGDEWHQTNPNDDSLQVHIKQADGSYASKYVKSKAAFISTSDGVSVEESVIHTYTHTKTDTVHNLAGSGNNISFLAAADIADGDTWTVNGNPVTAVLQNGEALPGELFKAGCWVTGVRLSDDGTQLFFKSAGGDKVTYNVFCQPTEPTSKTGLWLKTDAAIKPKKIVFDDWIWTAEGWQNPSQATAPIASYYTPMSVFYNGEIYMFGGQTYVYGESVTTTNMAIAYNPTTDTYRTLANLPAVINWGGCAEVGGKIYLFGGVNGSTVYSTAHVYDPVANTYSAIKAMPIAKFGMACATTKGKIYLFGGMNGSTVYSTAHVYDPVANTYSTIANLSIARYGAICSVINDKIFIFGGFGTPSGNEINTAVSYDPNTNTYTNLANLPAARTTSGCTVVGNEIFIIGGGSGGHVTASAIAYNYLTNSYRTLENMPHYQDRPVCALVGNIIYVMAGWRGGQASIVEKLMLTAKQYPDNPTVVLYQPGKNTDLSANLLATKLISAVKAYFKDVMLFRESDLTFPALYIGDGTQWTLARAAQ